MEPRIEPVIDLRYIFQITATTLSTLGMMLNGILVYLIFVKTPKSMSDYKKVLIQNCFVDILFNVINDIEKGQTDYKNGIFYVIQSDLLNSLPFPYDYFLTIFWIFAMFYCVTSIPVQFIYRYYLIVQEKRLSIVEYLKYLLISTIGAFSVVVYTSYVYWPEKRAMEARALLLKADAYYFKGVPKFIGADIRDWRFKLLFAYCYFWVTLSYGVIIVTSYQVWKTLKSLEVHLIPQTRVMHNQMTRTLILQALVPLIFIILPIGVAMGATFTMINIPGLGMITNLMCCWLPVVNPLVTIVSIKSYRDTVTSLFAMFCQIFHRKYSISSFQMSSTHFPSTQV